MHHEQSRPVRRRRDAAEAGPCSHRLTSGTVSKLAAGALSFASGAPGSATEDTLVSYQFTPNSSLVNDVVLTSDAAWFTDSFQAQLFVSTDRG